MKKINIFKGINETFGKGTKLVQKITFEKGFGYRRETTIFDAYSGRLLDTNHTNYFPFMCFYKSDEGVGIYPVSIHSLEHVEEMIEFLRINDVDFTEEQSQDLWAHLIAVGRSNAMYIRLKEGVEVDDLLEALKSKEMIDLYGRKESVNRAHEVGFSMNEINKLRV